MLNSIVFPGQGSQYLGMGKYLYDNFKVSKDVFDEVDEALGQKLTQIIFGENQDDLNLTTNTQPAIMTVSVATFKALEEEKGLKISDFKYCAGHSLGEYSALVLANSLRLSDSAKILKKRGEAMQSAVAVGKGAMAAVLNIEINELEKFINQKEYKTVQISNDNCPGQCVISGEKSDVENIALLLKNELNKKSIKLPVSAPFHCNMMKPAADELKIFIKQFTMTSPQIPFVSNVSAKPETEIEKIQDLLIECVFSRVRWREIVNFFIKDDITKLIECGPGKALTNMTKRFDSQINSVKIDNLDDLKKYE